MPTDFVELGPKAASTTILLAHGAGAPMDAPGMTMIAEGLAAQNLRIVRFEFAYMAQRRTEGRRKPPPRADKLNSEFLSAIEELKVDGRLIIGGKSMGGRVASMIADELFEAERVAGLLCAGYPFHPIGKPEKLRTEHLQNLRTPTLICQGTRDQFGTKAEVGSYNLSSTIQIEWFEDGDHDLKPRKRVSGYTHADHINAMGAAVSAWLDRINL
ncbi:alpha/beta family hydrolase [Ruegeria arenilitoris]|uniref:alpha/beta family hydrolase n=1 Tax=Ruegeria arenilitoris TaxID=1173585 RepID=UPI00147DCEA1|nr:alpha/beta family hydrolase [Ruegeria arenilitoris]